MACAGDGVLERCLVPSRNVQKRRKSSLERSWNGSAKTASALAAARAHEPANAARRTPPPGLKLRALVWRGCTPAATDAFTAFLDEEGGGGGGSKSSTPRANSAAAAAAGMLDLTVEPASQTAAGAGVGPVATVRVARRGPRRNTNRRRCSPPSSRRRRRRTTTTTPVSKRRHLRRGAVRGARALSRRLARLGRSRSRPRHLTRGVGRVRRGVSDEGRRRRLAA